MGHDHQAGAHRSQRSGEVLGGPASEDLISAPRSSGKGLAKTLGNSIGSKPTAAILPSSLWRRLGFCEDASFGAPGAPSLKIVLPKGPKPMPQIQLPIFPEGVTPITAVLAFSKRDGRVTYFNGSMPVFVHAEENRASFQMITAQFCCQRQCQTGGHRARRRGDEDKPEAGGEALPRGGTERAMMVSTACCCYWPSWRWRASNRSSRYASAPGEWGNLLGLDRVPQRLCLRATTDYWVNAMDDQPLFVVNHLTPPHHRR
jgi:hypothetical protein